MFKRITRQLAAKIGVLHRDDSGRLPWTAYKNVLLLLGVFTSSLMLAGMLLSYVHAVSVYPYYLPSSSVEEWAYGYTTSRNYLTYGFLNSGLLQDTSNSPFAADHPYVYTHMPAGPDLTLALVLKLTGNSYFSMRLVLAGLFIIGIWYYYRFAKLILDRLDLPGAGFTVLFVGPIAWMSIMERSVYVLFPLLAFAPYVALDAYYRSGRKRYLGLVVAVVFLSSIYIEYSLLTAVAICWIVLYLIQLVRIERRHLLLVVGTIFSGVLLHLLQNLLFLGPEVVLKDLMLTLSNRMVGFPSKEELIAFYQGANIVHHGSNPISLRVVIAKIVANFRSPLWWPCLMAAGLSVFLSSNMRIYRSGRALLTLNLAAIEPVRAICQLLIWVAAILLIPILMFPAYSQEVTLSWSRANSYYIAIVQCALTAFSLKQIYACCPSMYTNMHGKVVLRPVWRNLSAKGAREPRLERLLKYGILVFIVWLILQFALQAAKQYVSVLKSNLSSNSYVLLDHLKQYSGELYATNINTPIVGFFANAPGFGVCDDEVITPAGTVDASKCQTALMRQREVYARQMPTYFFLFAKGILMPGFAKPDMFTNNGYARLEERLQTRFAEIHKNELFRVFDLRTRAKD